MLEPLPPPPPLPDDAALFLDFDGTLVELADTPASIQVPPGLQGLLERVSRRLGGRLAIVSGRPIADLERHAGPLAVALSGSHGAELRLVGRPVSAPPPPAGLAAARAQVARFARTAQGLLVEEKPAGVALHYRRSPAEAERVRAFMDGLAVRTGLRLQHGKMVAELLPAGADKGEALRRIMREPPFAGARPLFVGDDLTDEHAFEAAAALGGGGILAGPARATAARWRLDGVAAVTSWLAGAGA
ncbi:MAG TPA: trehalose-phosphatase [Allosphingosinicella sp.]|jgi:trehalose 6-phosphate phosphatase